MNSTDHNHYEIPETIRISHSTYYRIRSHVIACLPEEACGLLASTGSGVVRRHFRVENIYHSPSRFQLKPEDQLKAFLWMEKHELPQMVIYHSHPAGPDHLSVTDITESYYPDAIYLLWFLDRSRWKLRAFEISNAIPKPIYIVIG
jgi:[CysO sulfur-carrier protein]-S-L-cysteine hydrolase